MLGVELVVLQSLHVALCRDMAHYVFATELTEAFVHALFIELFGCRRFQQSMLKMFIGCYSLGVNVEFKMKGD